jgi:hypothetical protein
MSVTDNASELIKRQMIETGITKMSAHVQEDAFCSNSLFSRGLDGENIVWYVYRFEF